MDNIKDDIFIYYAELPKGIHEIVIPGCEGYTIYIDKNLCQEEKMHAYRHALSHIKDGDFSKADVQKIELNAHASKSRKV